MKVYLVQHGDAVPKKVDPDRPLSEQGQADSEQLGDYLSRTGVELSRVLHSGKTRAAQTAEQIALALGIQSGAKVEPNLGPNDSVASMAGRLQNETNDLLIVGHMPYLGKLASLLVTGGTVEDLLAFRPGSLACLERDAEGQWVVTCFLRPEHLMG